MEIKAGKVQDPTWSKVWSGLKRSQKSLLIVEFGTKFHKSGQILKRGVRTRGFYDYELEFLKKAALKHGFAKETDFPGLQMDLNLNPAQK